jgi:hypothetical protein
MCKKANGLYLFLIIWYVAASVGAGVCIQLGVVSVPLWLQLVGTYIFLLPPVIVFILLNRINPARQFAMRVLKPLDVLLCILFGYMLVPMMLFLSQVTMLVVDNHMEETSLELYQAYPFLVQLLLMAVVPAVAEEFIFRGVLYHMYRKNGIAGAAVMSALCFALLHLNFNQFVYAFALGVVFALLVEATGSIYSSMLAHAACNSYSVIVMNVVPQEMLEGDVSETTMAARLAAIVFCGVLMVVFGAVAYLVYVALARRNRRVLYMAEKLSQGLKAQNGERFVTLAFVLALAFGIFMMVLVDFV